MPVLISPERKLIVLHTPKCGGSSLLSSLSEIFGRNSIYRDYKYIKGQRTVRPEAIEAPIIYGHFRAEQYAHEKDAYWVTLLRHPVDRMLSMYFNWRFSSPEPLKNDISDLRAEVLADKVSLLDFARKPVLANRLSGFYFRNFDMNRFNIIIPHENYDGGIAKLSLDLGVDLPINYANVSSSRSTAYKRAREHVEADGDLMAALREILEKDLAFYERTMQLSNVVREKPDALGRLSLDPALRSELSELAERMAARMAARRLADGEWRKLSKARRQRFIEQARSQITQEDRHKASKRTARKTARKLGYVWRALSQQQRRQLVIRSRRG